MTQNGRRGLIPADLLHFRWLEEIALAPSGEYLAYTVKQPNADQNDYRFHLYVHDLESGRVHSLTPEDGRVAALAWDRTGMRLAYSWDCGGEATIQIWHARERRLSHREFSGAPFSNLDWAPDGRRLAAVRWTPSPDLSPRRLPSGVPAPCVKEIRRLRYKQDGGGWVHDRYRQIWILDLETGVQSQLTRDEMDHSEPRWSWSGRWLAFTATAREQDSPAGYGQIYLYDTNTGTSRALMRDWPGAALSPRWRKDDGAIAFTGHDAPPPVNRRRFYHLWLYDLEREAVQNLTETVDQTIGNYAVADQRAGLTTVTVDWPSGEGPLTFLLTEAGAVNLCQVLPGGSVNRLTQGDQVTFAFSAASQGVVAYGQATPENPGDLFLWHKGAAARLTDLNPWLRDHILAVPKSYTYRGLEGAPVHAWLVEPLGFRPDREYPTIVYVHCSMFSWDFNHEIQCLAQAGYLVVYFNQLGTTAGYGQQHALGNYYGSHEQEFAEIMLGVDELTRRPYVDALRLGVTGGSCGGFMTNWIVGHTDRFAAAITQRSVSDLISKFGTSDNGPEQALSEGGGTPWQNPTLLWESSPLSYVHQIQTPLLILHSEEDHRCALGQAEELFSALRWLGKPVELVIFEGESHGLSRGGKPGNRIERLERIHLWFNRYLKAQ